MALTLLSTNAGWGAPRPDADPAQHGSGHDCPGRAVAAEPAPPPLVRFRAVPYGYVEGYAGPPAPTEAPPAPRADYRAQVYRVVECPQTPVGDRFVGLDHLVTLMGHEGLKFYRSPDLTLESGPDGIIGADDVVVIKINYQWSERGGSNVDVLRGLVRRLVDHPDGFTGEIIVCENSQFASLQGFDRAANNAEDHSLSPHDVVSEFAGLGHGISHYSWTAIRTTEVVEYDQGDMADGYVVYPYDAQLQGRISYPKFRSDAGTHVSIRHGVWDTASESYDRQKLKFINLPVLKSHHSTYGVTACVKNYMGCVTGALATNSHVAIEYGILGAQLGEIQLADLNILDCIWINANPYSGPACSYDNATRRDQLIASLDPVAADLWATQNILIPAFLANGYTPPWPYPSADPDDPNSEFRTYLDNSMDRILLAGSVVTNDPLQIDAYTWSGRGDLEGDGVADTLDNCPYDPNPQQGDCDGDGVGDACDCMSDTDGDGTVGIGDLLQLLANWGPCVGCPGDVDCSGNLGINDFLSMLGSWGACPP